METENELWVSLHPYPESQEDLETFHYWRDVLLDSVLMGDLYEAEINLT